MFRRKKKKDETIDNLCMLVDYVDVLDRLNKCNNSDILDMAINICNARKKKLNEE